jgi:hypothetical protein
MTSHNVTTVLTSDGKLALNDLPFRAGQSVVVIVLESGVRPSGSQPLRGTVLRYDEPFEPVADSDWHAAS